jgi:hypothetical protein
LFRDGEYSGDLSGYPCTIEVLLSTLYVGCITFALMNKIAPKFNLCVMEQCQGLKVRQISNTGILPLLFNSEMEPVSDLATDLI